MGKGGEGRDRRPVLPSRKIIWKCPPFNQAIPVPEVYRLDIFPSNHQDIHIREFTAEHRNTPSDS